MLKIELDVQEIELTKKNAKAEELIKVVQKETEKVKFEKDKGISLFSILYNIVNYIFINKFKINIINYYLKLLKKKIK